MFLFATALFTFGQEATIVGTVTDPSGAAVAGAAVTITNSETGQVHHFTTGSEGQYVAPELRIGHYSLRAEAKGFKVVEQKGIVLGVGDRTRLDFKLEVGTAQEQVTVEGTTVAVQTDSGEVSDLITGKQVSQLTTNGRSIYTLVNLSPGTTSLQGDFQTPTPVGGDANVSFNGQRMSHNIYLLDGGENLDRGGAGTFSVMPSIESVAEFRALTSNYSAEYGLSSAGTMTTALKSGTRTLHASAWEFLRNDALDARNWFNPAPNKIAKLRFNTYGFNVGGPVDFWRKEHKTFFFYNMEWRSLIQGQTLNQTVPLPDTYGGDFTGNVPVDVNDVNGDPIPNSGLFVPCAQNLSGAQITRFNDAGITQFSTPDADGGCAPNKKVTAAENPTFRPFPLNAIPAALLDGNAQALLNAGIFPAPTTGAKLQGGASVPTHVREEIVRIDHNFTDKFSIFGHWISEQISQSFGNTMWSGDNVPTIGNTFGNPSYSAVIHVTHAISPRLLNEIAFNYNGNRINILPKAGFGAPLAAPADFTFNRIFTGPNADSRIPTINLSSQTGAQYSANWTPWVNKADDYQIRDDISWTRGAHQFRMGASWALYKKIQDVFASTQGNFGFNGFYTGNDFADYLLGYANSYSEDGVHDNGHWNNISWAAYIQDNWRATRRLTVNLGLRWDGVPHTYEANSRMSNFYPGLYDQSLAATFDNNGNICGGAGNGCAGASPGLGTSPNPILAGYQFYLNGIGVDGKNGIPKGLVDNHWTAFGPRIGFAYDVTGQGKTVIRGGFGTMYERIQGNDMYDGGTNVPFSAHASFSNVLLADPHTQVGGTGATLSVPIVPADITGLARDNYKLPVSYQYSIGVQQALGAKSMFSIAYVGNQNRHQSDRREINLPDPADLPGLVASGGAGYNQLVPYLGYRAIRLSNNEANAHYNALQADVHFNLKDLSLQFGYTLSKAVDPTGNINGNTDGYDLNNVSNPYLGWKYDVGPSPFDRKHVAFVNFVYELPILNHSPNRLLKSTLGGWSLSGIVTLQSGAPFNVLLGGTSAGSVVQNSQNRPDLTGSIHYTKKMITLANGNQAFQWFDPSVFADPAPGTWGNLPAHALRGPGRDNWNLALHKNFVFNEERGTLLEFRAESFNTWNHTQFRADQQGGGISNSTTASDFGTFNAAFDPRVFQLGLRLVF